MADSACLCALWIVCLESRVLKKDDEKEERSLFKISFEQIIQIIHHSTVYRKVYAVSKNIKHNDSIERSVFALDSPESFTKAFVNYIEDIFLQICSRC
jgi:hypothetical protein